MMIDIEDSLMTAWITLLDGNISVPVYDTAVPDSESGNYLQLRFESETEQPISSRFWTKPVMIVEAVTVFQTVIDPKIARGIMNEVSVLLANVTSNNLPAQSGLQIGNVYKQSVSPIEEFDGSKYWYRIPARYKHDIIQPQN